jgi:regulatory protein
VRSARPKLLDSEKLMQYALKCLGGRAHSMGELRVKLRRRAETAADVDSVLRKLKESGYLDDRRFAETYATSRLENAGLGRMRVLRDLRQRQVGSTVAEQAVESTFRDTNEDELIQAFLERKYRNRPLPAFLAVDKNLASAFRRLRYAGFSAGNSIRVLKRYAKNEEALESLESEEVPEGAE